MKKIRLFTVYGYYPVIWGLFHVNNYKDQAVEWNVGVFFLRGLVREAETHVDEYISAIYEGRVSQHWKVMLVVKICWDDSIFR